MIDLRSDTVTQPTEGMRKAIAEAVVGDEQKREDPTVLDLERRVAELLGHEDAVFLPTATMANHIALKLLSRPGDVLIAERHSHVVVYEYGGAAVHAGLMVWGVPGEGGRITSAQIRAAVPERTKAADQAPSLVSLENTHNNAGGRVWPLEELRDVIETAREVGLGVHLDGARLLNASIALGCPPAQISAEADTVTLCLSKGLGCPLGALLASSAPLVERARREKHLFGGAMRQAGIVAAAGVYALEHHVERLAEDHARARRLAEGLDAAGVPVALEQVETNFVQIDVAALELSRTEALDRLREAGVGLSATIHPTVVRAVVHLGITDDDVERAVELVPRALLPHDERRAREAPSGVPETQERPSPAGDRSDEVPARRGDLYAADA